MSIGTLQTVMARIKVATPQSPISVFIDERKRNGKTIRLLDARFANTVGGLQRKLAYHKPRSSDEGQVNWRYEWIGDYHQWHSVKEVRALLTVALEK
jgi:hypothetical protein